ncbi:hypothetical protein BLNAU_24653 [Blattamonas nauphoetae]|nr:hypothetical protein BLNAU_24653 [Blattamonas nauphoetae]
MDPENTAWIPVLHYLVDLLKEMQVDFEQYVKVLHVFRRVCADIRNQLMHPEGTGQPELSCLETVEDDIMLGFQKCLKTIGTVLVIFGELIFLSPENEQIAIDTGIYPLLGEMLDWLIVVTREGTPPVPMSAEEDYEYFRAAVETESELEKPFHLLYPLKIAFRQHNLRPLLPYRSSIPNFVVDDAVDEILSIYHILELNRTKDSLLNNVLYLLGNALGGTPALVEVVLSSLFPDVSATEATRKVIDRLQAILFRLPMDSLKELMRCIYLFATMPLEHQSVLVESGMLLLAWNHRWDLGPGGTRYLVHSFMVILRPTAESSHTVAMALQEQIENDSFEMELDQMCQHSSPNIRKSYQHLRTFLETIPKRSLCDILSMSDYGSST